MRLLIVSQYFWPENFRVNDLVIELVQRGHQVTVLTGYPNYPDGKVYPAFHANPLEYSRYAGADVVRVPMTSRGQNGFTLVLNYFTFAISASAIGPWKLRGRKFDGIFVFEPSPITVGIPGAVLRFIKRAPLVFWVLDLWPETLHAVGAVQSKVALRAVGGLVKLIYMQCDLILAQSKSFLPQIQKYAPADARVEYFPSWSESNFDLTKANLAEEIVADPAMFNVMFAGNIGDAQDFPAILSAAEKLKDNSRIRWLIVGDGRKSTWVAEQIKARGLQNCVILLGRYPLERMPSFFKHADALLVSLKNEPVFALTIPGKVQSYLAAGIPIVAMLNGEGAQVVSDAHAGFSCPAGDTEGLARIVLKLSMMSKEELQVMGDNGIEFSLREFSREKLVDRLENWLMDFPEQRRKSVLLGGRP